MQPASEVCFCSLVHFPPRIAHVCRIVFTDLAGWRQQNPQTHLNNINEVIHCAVLLHEYVSIVYLVLLQWQGRHRPGHQQDLAVPLSSITQAWQLQPWRTLYICSGSAPVHCQLGRGPTAVHLCAQVGGGFNVAVHATGSGYIRAGTGLISRRTWSLPLYPSPKLGSCISRPEGLEHCWRPLVDEQEAGLQRELAA